jgi:lipoprotein-releasing system permease protein
MKLDGYYIDNAADIEKKIKTNKDVVGTSPFIYRQAIIRNMDSSASVGLLIKAVDLKKENDMTGLLNHIEESDINFNGKLNDKSIVLGSELARNLAVSTGNEVLLMFPVSFTDIPKMYKFKVVAIIHSGMYDYDASLGFIDIKAARIMFSMKNSVSGISVQAKYLNKAESLAKEIGDNLGENYLIRAWTEMNKNLFLALKLEKVMMFLILGLIILVAAFNIISNLLLLSVQKSKEIGILSALGFSRFSIAKIFFYEGLIVGLSGSILGVIFGVSVSALLKYFDLIELPHGVYYIEKLPIAILPTDIISVALCAFIITLLAGLYPAYQVSKLDPLKAMRD